MAKSAQKIAAGKFKIHCLRLIDEVHNKHTQLVITKHGKPFAKLIPFSDESSALFGCLKDSVTINGDIISSTGEEWDADH